MNTITSASFFEFAIIFLQLYWWIIFGLAIIAFAYTLITDPESH